MRVRRKARMTRRVASLAVAVAVGTALLVTGAQPASAAVPSCGAPTDTCYVQPVEDTYTTPFETNLVVNVSSGKPSLFANDLGPTGTTLSLEDSEVDSWFGGTIDYASNGYFTYTPPEDWSGIDYFDYYLSAGDDLASVTVEITVQPIVTDDTYYTQANRVLEPPAPGVYGNDAGIDSTFAEFDDVSEQSGDVELNDDGSFQYVPAPDFQGDDAFTYTVSDLNLDNDATGTVHVVVDSVKPSGSLSKPTSGSTTLATKIPLQWSGVDNAGPGVSGIKSYDVTQRVANYNGNFGPSTYIKTNTTSTTLNVTGGYGRTYCFNVRARDKALNNALWPTEKCTVIPMKAASMATSTAGWAFQNSSAYFGGQVRRTATKNAKLTRTGIIAKKISLVATKCAACGVVQIRWNGVVTANVNLYSASTKYKQVIQVASFTGPKAGTLTATVTSPTGKHVIIEGLAVNHG